ncbi:hypothetical protein [Kineococcus sp. SYSU DK006]|uniref:hypothetical protein n=1 Tax=Kineococcus sp. SYSU DK006 TaxID=3383127 RepID=UPI003D7CDA12
MRKTEVIEYFGGPLRRFESEHPGTSVVHDTTTALAPQFVRAEPTDVGCFNDDLELARYIERGVLSDLSQLPSAAGVRTDFKDLTDQYATYPAARASCPARWPPPASSTTSGSSPSTSCRCPPRGRSPPRCARRWRARA